MRARPFAIAAAALLGACASVRPMTQSDREQASRAAMEKKPGTVLTEGEIAKLDLDTTFVCEVSAQVGSHIPHLQCRSLRRVERERAAARGFVADGSASLKGFVPGEVAAAPSDLKQLMATNGNKVVKEERAPSGTAPAGADQDPRFPPL